jgi:DNA/RNA-binding domain of Phe-tRNA-synthetase-like protein
MTPRIVVAPHPLLEVGAFVTRFATVPPETPPAVVALIAPDVTEFRVDEAVKTAVRDLLRAGGFKPAGRSKPASEYLVTALAEGRFPRINAVDACNVVSLHTGLPISLVDVDKLGSTTGELRVACAPAATSYIFNPSGQTIDASHLLCVLDDLGPTGTPV